MSHNPVWYKEYYQKNKLKIQAKHRRLYLKKCETEESRKLLREQNRQWKAVNKEIIKRSSKRYYETHKDQKHAYYEANREKISKANKLWKKNNPEKVRVIRWNERKRRSALIHKAPGKFSLRQWRELLNIYDHTCPKCFRKEPEIKLTIDHKIPLSRSGTNYIDNIQPLCMDCNRSKHAKTWFAHYPINYKQYVT
jgi:5-methylcytosine-specific restriction endonuclease McrA